MKEMTYFSKFKVSSFLFCLFAITLNGYVFGDSQEDNLSINNLTISENSKKFYSSNFIDSNIEKALRRDSSFLGKTDFYLYQALDALSGEIKDKNVAIIGSDDGWYESILLTYGAKPVVIVSAPIQTEDFRITYLTIEQYRKNPFEFDLVINIRNLSNNKNGNFYDISKDLEIMMDMKAMLSLKGKLLLAIPVGPVQDKEHIRHVYGESDLKFLFKSWKIISYYGFTSEYLFHGIDYLPIFLLQNKG